MGKKLSRQLMTSASLKVDTQSSERLDFDILVPPYCASFCVFKPCSIAFSNSDKGSYAECRRLCAFMCFPVPALVIAEPLRAVSELFEAMSDFSVFHFYHSIFPSLEKKNPSPFCSCFTQSSVSEILLGIFVGTLVQWSARSFHDNSILKHHSTEIGILHCRDLFRYPSLLTDP